MRVIGLDYGSKTVGVASSDELMLTAQPLTTIHRDRPTKLRQTLAQIEQIIEQYDVDRIVVGWPKKLDNEEGERCEKTKEFGDMLENRTGLEIIYQDERLTTAQADGVLEQGGIRKDKRKQYIDKMAASLILQNYLDTLVSPVEQVESSYKGYSDTEETKR